jgi:hypothetical protein
MPYCHIIPKIEKYRPVCAQVPESSHKHIDSIERRYDFIIQSFSPVPETLNNPGSRAHFPAPSGNKNRHRRAWSGHSTGRYSITASYP